MITDYVCGKCGAKEPDLLIEVAVLTTAVARKADGKYEIVDELDTVSTEILCQGCYDSEFGG